MESRVQKLYFNLLYVCNRWVQETGLFNKAITDNNDDKYYIIIHRSNNKIHYVSNKNRTTTIKMT